MIIITGGAGFIGSCTTRKLNELGSTDIVIVDELGTSDKWKNLRNLKFLDFIHKDDFLVTLDQMNTVSLVIHYGACSSTTLQDGDYFIRNNTQYTETLARHCLLRNIRFIYASSAATYGDGSKGYCDDERQINSLRPLNMYGYSKHLFDLKAVQEGWFDRIVGLKFFNVFGPNEYHKDDMSSVVFKAFRQIMEKNQVRLFKSHNPVYRDGEQKRDFIYVKEAVNIVQFFIEHPDISGLFNVGTGQARSFNDLAIGTFRALNREPAIRYFDMPETVRDRYQYYTEADTTKLLSAGYRPLYTSLEDGITDYVQEYLSKGFAHW